MKTRRSVQYSSYAQTGCTLFSCHASAWLIVVVSMTWHDVLLVSYCDFVIHVWSPKKCVRFVSMYNSFLWTRQKVDISVFVMEYMFLKWSARLALLLSMVSLRLYHNFLTAVEWLLDENTLDSARLSWNFLSWFVYLDRIISALCCCEHWLCCVPSCLSYLCRSPTG